MIPSAVEDMLGLSGEEAIHDKRVRVLRLHVDELTRQSKASKVELLATQLKLRQLEQERSAAQPQERKLFSKLQQLQVRTMGTPRTRVLDLSSPLASSARQHPTPHRSLVPPPCLARRVS
jgi:hypothetical protein